jgi:hypothetical protein
MGFDPAGAIGFEVGVELVLPVTSLNDLAGCVGLGMFFLSRDKTYCRQQHRISVTPCRRYIIPRPLDIHNTAACQKKSIFTDMDGIYLTDRV